MKKSVLFISAFLLLGCVSSPISSQSSTSSSTNSFSSSENSSLSSVIESSSSSNNSIISISRPDSETSSSSSISSSEIEYVYEIPKTLGDLYNAVYSNMDTEGKETSVSYHKSTTKSYYSNSLAREQIIEENLTMYKDFSYTLGTSSIKWENAPDSSSMYAPVNKTYTTYKGVKGEYFYAITDYEIGKEDDTARKYLIIDEGTPDNDEILKQDLDFNTSMFASYYFLTYINNYFMINLGETARIGYEEVGSDLKYSIIVNGSPSGDEYGSYILDYTMDVVINKEDGFLKAFDFGISQTEATENELLTTVKESYIVDRGERSNETIDYEDPENYWLKEYTIGFWYPDPEHMGERLYCKNNTAPVGTFVFPYAETYSPEKALDLDLTAVSSDNESIISVDGSGFISNQKGTCNVSVTSSNGITEKTEITIGNVDITSIKLFLYHGISYQGNIFPGDQFEILYTINPAGTLEDITFESADESIARVAIIQNTPYLIAVKPGETTITASSKANPNRKGTLDVTVSDNTLNISSLLKPYRWYHLYADLNFYFNDDMTGYYIFEGNKVNFSFEDLGSYQFRINNLTWINGNVYNAEATLRSDLSYFNLTILDEYDEEYYSCNLFKGAL